MKHPLKYCLTAGSVLSAIMLAGCVSQSDYDALKAQNEQLQQQVAAKSATIARLQGAIKYTVNSDLLFKSGSWDLSADGKKIISRLAEKLAPSQENKIAIIGYTDDAPIGPALKKQGVTSNEVLSQKRADAVMQYMISQGVNPEYVSAQGRGDADPVASNSTPQGRAQNRRVELTLGGPVQ